MSCLLVLTSCLKINEGGKTAFQDFINLGFDKSSDTWITYKAIWNNKNNAIRDAKIEALNGKEFYTKFAAQWEKIKIFKGTNTDQENKIDNLEIDGTKCTENCKWPEPCFSSIGIKLNDEASIASNSKPTNQFLWTMIRKKFSLILNLFFRMFQICEGILSVTLLKV